MNSVVKRGTENLPKHILQNSRPTLPLDVLLALDRMVIEVSMQLYNVDSRERSSMRRHSRRWHARVKEHFPRLPKSRART